MRHKLGLKRLLKQSGVTGTLMIALAVLPAATAYSRNENSGENNDILRSEKIAANKFRIIGKGLKLDMLVELLDELEIEYELVELEEEGVFIIEGIRATDVKRLETQGMIFK